jgi:hypothetical protein
VIAKKKECISCGNITYIWARKMCKMCASKGYKKMTVSKSNVVYQGQSMPNHAKVYLQRFGYDSMDTVISEITGQKAVDINHLDPRGMGGSKEKDLPENLMALTRYEHDIFENYPELKEWFVKVHLSFIATSKPYYLININDIPDIIKQQ